MKEFGHLDERMVITAANEMCQFLSAQEPLLGANSLIWRKIREAVIGRMDLFRLIKVWQSGEFTFQSPISGNEQLSFVTYSDPHRIIVDWRIVLPVDFRTKSFCVYGLDSSSWKNKPRITLYKSLFLSTSERDLSLSRVAPFGPLDVDYIQSSESASIDDEDIVVLQADWKNGVEYTTLTLPVPQALERFTIPD